MANLGIVMIGEEIYPRQAAFSISLLLSSANIEQATATKENKNAVCDNIGYVLDCTEEYCVKPGWKN